MVPALLNTAFAQGYDTLRIATYNVLNYSSSSTDSSSRNPEFRKILRAMDPDIMVIQEVLSAASETGFLNNVLNAGRPNTYSSAPFNNGPDTDNSMFFKSAKLSFIGSQTILHTALRDINGYRLRPAGITADSLDIQIFSAHLKADQGYENDRAAEAETLRTYLDSQPAGNFVVAGDFNLYTSSEPAYQKLIESRPSNNGRMYDPINRPGNWHNTASFAGIHTQATRAADGGLDDRFDHVMLSYGFQSLPGWEYVTGSYTAYGNDGNHFNQSINVLPNYAVPDSIANALFNASDHLPAFLQVRRALPSAATISLVSPNGGEAWYVGSSHNITWSSQGVSGTITLKLNRNYPSGAWEALFSSIANSGSQAWTTTAPATTVARVQILSDAQPSVSDISDANFSIPAQTVTVQSPNGSETWTVGQSGTIAWGSSGVSGNVRIELNRSFPSANWEVLFGSAVNDGSESWIVTSPATSHARVRIFSVSAPYVGDTSDADFSIGHSAPPVILHDPHGDAQPGAVTFTARVTDDFPGFSTELFYHSATSGTFDSVTMNATGYPAEYSAAPTLSLGRWSYFIRATDSELQTTSTDTFGLSVAAPCGIQLAYDDGTAELFNWSPADSVAWAVRFTPVQVPFVLCEAEASIAAFHPDSSHSLIGIRVYAADGPGGVPGTLLRDVIRGSVGNIVGGFPHPGAFVARFILSDDSLQPLVFNSDFYVAVLNSGSGEEAFAMDTSSSLAGRSIMYDACRGVWLPEDGSDSSIRRGNRMIRAHGWIECPPKLVISRQNNDMRLDWSAIGSAYYRIYRSLSVDFASAQLISTTSDTTFVVPGEIANQTKAFYSVVASSSQ